MVEMMTTETTSASKRVATVSANGADLARFLCAQWLVQQLGWYDTSPDR